MEIKDTTAKHVLEFDAIGTFWKIQICSDLGIDQVAVLRSEILDRIAVFDKDYSRFRNDSLVTEMANTPGTYALPDDAKPMFDLYHELYKLTEGKFTPLIGDLMVDAGYDAEYSLKPKENRKSPMAWDDAMEYKFPNLTTKQSVLLDVGAIGKGYLVDIVSDIVKKSGIKSFTVDAGGDIYHFDGEGKKIIIGFEHPENEKQVIGTVELGNESLCGSSGNRRTWDQFHHIIDPHTLASPRHILATWVIAPNTMLADALATCLYLTDSKRLVDATYSFEYLILFSDHSIEKSRNFPGTLFTQ